MRRRALLFAEALVVLSIERPAPSSAALRGSFVNLFGVAAICLLTASRKDPTTCRYFIEVFESGENRTNREVSRSIANQAS